MRCTAKAKSTQEQCRRSARAGWNVCRVHGAGSADRPGGRPRSDKTIFAGMAPRMARARQRKATQDLSNAFLHVVMDHIDAIGLAFERKMALRHQNRPMAEVDAEIGQLEALTKLSNSLAAMIKVFAEEYPEAMASIMGNPNLG